MRPVEIIRRWRAVVASVDAKLAEHRAWDEGEPVDYFLHAFRPCAARSRLPELAVGLPELHGVIERLREVFERADPDLGHAYLVVTRPRAMDDRELIKRARSWLRTVRDLAPKLDVEVRDDVRAYLRQRAMPIEVRQRDGAASEASSDPHPMSAVIADTMTELTGRIPGASAATELLVEPLYILATSYALAMWILTPAVARWREVDPFADFAALWQAGTDLAFHGEGRGITTTVVRPVLTP